MSDNNTKLVYFKNTLNPKESTDDNRIYSDNVRLTTDDLSYEFPKSLKDKQLSKMMALRKSEAKPGQKPSFRYVEGVTLYPSTSPIKQPNRASDGFEMTCIYKPKRTITPQAGIVL